MTTPDADRVFIDTNILVYATLAQSAFHSSARGMVDSYLDREATVCASNQVLREFLSCTTRPGIMLEPLDRMEALDHVQGFIEQFEILTDSATTAEKLYQLLREVDCCGKQVHDANIVATMLVADVSTLLTANVKDFRRFESYISVLSLPAVAEL